jgi:phosphate/sulfate permease
MATIAASPSSAAAPPLAANRSGLPWGTVRNLLVAWVRALPAAMMISVLDLPQDFLK